MEGIWSPLLSIRKHKLALLIPAHNEQLSIQALIYSAIASGQPRQDIFVVNDGSTDATVYMATTLLKPNQIFTVKRSGKAKAIESAIAHFDLTSRYTWIHTADADGMFGRDYFKQFRRNLNSRRYIAATGYVLSLGSGWISRYRGFEYVKAQEVTRRLQRALGVISVIPGPTFCFQSKIYPQLNFKVGSLTEDFDLTLQIHRSSLGHIQYIPSAKVYTQEPLTFKHFCQQIRRWYRGFFQGVRRHNIGRQARRIDFYLSYTALAGLVGCGLFFIIVPLAAILNLEWLATYFLFDLAVFITQTALVATVLRRWDELAAFPLFYILRTVSLVVFFIAFIEVLIFDSFQAGSGIWATEGRRYRLVS